jgi:hypothetical protein
MTNLWFLMATSVLHSQYFRFQITIYLIGNWDFFSINTYICVLNQGAHTSFSKIIFWKQIRMSLVLVHNWHETAVFTKYKHIILTWINSLQCSAWQLSFQNVQNVSVKSKLHLVKHYPHSSRWNKHNTLQLCDSRRVTQNHGNSPTSISMSVPCVEFHGISFSY